MAKSSKRKWSAIEGRYITPPRENLPETDYRRDRPTGTLSVSGKKLTPEEEHELLVQGKRDIAAIKSGKAEPIIAQNPQLTAEQEAQIRGGAIMPESTVPESTVPESTVPLSKSIKGAIPGIITNIVTKTGAGAAGGAISGGILGSIIPGAGTAIGAGGGAIIGGAGGFVTGAFSAINELKEEEQQQTKIEYKSFTDARTRLKAVVTYAKTGDPIKAITMWDNEKARIYRAESNLKSLSERDWLSKAKDELGAILNFRDRESEYDQMFIDALNKNPNPEFEFDLGEEAAQ